MMIKTKDIQVHIEQLLLDPNNYRLFGEKEVASIPDSDAEGLQDVTLDKLKGQRLGELKDSIRNHGFLEMERMVVRLLDTTENKEQKDDSKKKFIVVEGNRRAAALKSLEKNAGVTLSEKMKNLNVILIEGDKEEIKLYSATLMGIRHVSGPKKWDGFQSAKLINDLYIDGKSYTEIGDILGISSREAGRRYRGYKAFEQMRSHPEFRDKVEPRHYGLLLEFLSPSKKGKEWLEWDDAKFSFENEERLKAVYKAITPSVDDELEIKNPGDARKFVSLLDTEYVSDLEQGESIHGMPDPQDLKETGKLKRIQSFISFVEKNSFSPEEYDRLNDLKESIENKMED